MEITSNNYDYNFSKLVNALHQALEDGYLPGAINWVDEKYANGWTKEINKMDVALIENSKRRDQKKLKQIVDSSRTILVNYLKLYRETKLNGDKVLDLINSLEVQTEFELNTSSDQIAPRYSTY